MKHHTGELLTKDRSVTIHHRNIRALAIEIYKVKLRGNKFLERRRVKSFDNLTKIPIKRTERGD